MSVTAYLYSKCPYNLLKKLISDLSSGSTALKVMLTTSAYTPDQESHDFKDDITNEITGTGYTAGGAEITSKSVTEASKVTTLDGADVTWAASTITARRAVIYDATPATDATRALLAYIDFGEEQSSSNGNFTIQWNTLGIITLAVP